jgi:NAD(P)-dependent dehydrogenase (short-subunit alcohol dehydrogenase family)
VRDRVDDKSNERAEPPGPAAIGERQSSPRIVLITGASSGIGKACSNHLSQKGYRVYGTSRRAGVQRLSMDVTREDSVARGVRDVLEQEGRIDAVVNNAGFSLVGAVEDTDLDEAREQIETNFFGVVRVCRAVLPAMRDQGSGYIVNISSLGGLIGLPFQAFYSASKFAIEGFTEALRMEVRGFGIRVALVEPGDHRTAITANRRRARASEGTSAYSENFFRALRTIETNEVRGPTPERVARVVERILASPTPRLRYPVGAMVERAAAPLRKMVSPSLFEWALMRYYRLR